MGDLNDILQEHGPEAVRAHIDSAKSTNSKGNATAKPKPQPRAESNWRDNVITAAQLQRMTFPLLSFVVPGLIPEGLSIVAGRPKVGKSWLALDACLAVASGRPCLGNRKPTQGDVLYCALEDSRRRLQSRIDKLISPISDSWPERVTLATSWSRLDQGGADDIASWADSVDEPRLVVLDTLAAVRPARSGNNGYTEDYESVASLHQLAKDIGIAIVVLHHTRKMEAEDPIDTVSGTLGLTGCADTILVLRRESRGTTLYLRGRDIEEAEHAVTFDKQSCRWSILGEANEVHRSNERNCILAALRLSGADELAPQEIAATVGMTDTNVRKLLGKMVEDGELEKRGRGKYRLPESHRDPDLRPPVTLVT